MAVLRCTIFAAFKREGWQFCRQSSSHVILEKKGHDAILSVPVHKGKNVKRGTLRDLIRDAGLTVKEFMEQI